MFTPDSRYRRSKVVTAMNRAGQPIKTVELRLPPRTDGIFQHTVAEGERIDSLAHKFYREPRKWWRIADANPDFPTPDSLLGQSPVVSERIALAPPASPAPWAQALAAGMALPGVLDLARAQAYELLVEPHTVLGETVDVVTEQIQDSVLATYNPLAVDPALLLAAFTARGFVVIGREVVSRVGQPIVIPPDGGP
jgi:hypothetical protein